MLHMHQIAEQISTRPGKRKRHHQRQPGRKSTFMAGGRSSFCGGSRERVSHNFTPPAHVLRVWKEPRTLRSHVRRRIGLSSVITGLAKNSDFQADSAVSVVKHRNHAGLPSPTDKQDPKLRLKSRNGKPAHYVTSPVRPAPQVRAPEHQIHSG
jgi:hypothetical protein